VFGNGIIESVLLLPVQLFSLLYFSFQKLFSMAIPWLLIRKDPSGHTSRCYSTSRGIKARWENHTCRTFCMNSVCWVTHRSCSPSSTTHQSGHSSMFSLSFP